MPRVTQQASGKGRNRILLSPRRACGLPHPSPPQHGREPSFCHPGAPFIGHTAPASLLKPAGCRVSRSVCSPEILPVVCDLESLMLGKIISLLHSGGLAIAPRATVQSPTSSGRQRAKPAMSRGVSITPAPPGPVSMCFHTTAELSWSCTDFQRSCCIKISKTRHMSHLYQTAEPGPNFVLTKLELKLLILCHKHHLVWVWWGCNRE